MTDVRLLCGGDHAQAYVVMTYNAAMGSALHQSAIFKTIIEWDRGKLSLLRPQASNDRSEFRSLKVFVQISGKILGCLFSIPIFMSAMANTATKATTKVSEVAAESISAQPDISARSGALGDEAKAIQVGMTADAYKLRAGLRDGRGDRAGAISDWTAAIALNPDDDWSYEFRARAYEALGNYKLALADIDKLRRIKQAHPSPVYPDVPGTYAWQAQIRMAMGDVRGAIADYTEAIKQQPQESAHYWGRAQSRRQARDYTNALADYTQVIQLEPCNFLAYQNRAELHAALKDYPSAIADYSEAIRLVPQSRWSISRLYLGRGAAYDASKQNQTAIADYTRAIRADPQSKAAYLARSAVRSRTGDTIETRSDRKKAASLPKSQNIGEIIHRSPRSCIEVKK
jgi:tetratricopeptide (TPR) repeat protein